MRGYVDRDPNTGNEIIVNHSEHEAIMAEKARIKEIRNEVIEGWLDWAGEKILPWATLVAVGVMFYVMYIKYN